MKDPRTVRLVLIFKEDEMDPRTADLVQIFKGMKGSTDCRISPNFKKGIQGPTDGRVGSNLKRRKQGSDTLIRSEFLKGDEGIHGPSIWSYFSRGMERSTAVRGSLSPRARYKVTVFP